CYGTGGNPMYDLLKISARILYQRRNLHKHTNDPKHWTKPSCHWLHYSNMQLMQDHTGNLPMSYLRQA
uniref:Uncharacterized protein n=1 Tax=Poecilia mexicana TaxID=48701 RepID=A0A3B3Y7W6_9TELE